MSNELRKAVADTRRRHLERGSGPKPSFVRGDVASGSVREQEPQQSDQGHNDSDQQPQDKTDS